MPVHGGATSLRRCQPMVVLVGGMFHFDSPGRVDARSIGRLADCTSISLDDRVPGVRTDDGRDEGPARRRRAPAPGAQCRHEYQYYEYILLIVHIHSRNYRHKGPRPALERSPAGRRPSRTQQSGVHGRDVVVGRRGGQASLPPPRGEACRGGGCRAATLWGRGRNLVVRRRRQRDDVAPLWCGGTAGLAPRTGSARPCTR